MDTYPLTPNRITSHGVEFKTKVIESESGYEQRASLQANPKYRFALCHELVNLNDEGLIVNFFIEKKGMMTKFYFVNHIDSKTYECRFAKEGITIERINAMYSNITVELVTC